MKQISIILLFYYTKTRIQYIIKCDDLCSLGGQGKSLLAACYTFCFEMLSEASLVEEPASALMVIPRGIKSTAKAPRLSQSTVTIIQRFDSPLTRVVWETCFIFNNDLSTHVNPFNIKNQKVQCTDQSFFFMVLCKVVLLRT